ncbi:MAG: hypothetical protein H8E05_00265 [Bacteroidetes bacterium]|nr:hypothetical protein [Bacteroidota bacterium]
MKDKLEIMNKPHYMVNDGEGGVKFDRSHEGLEAAIELAQELDTWVASTKRFIERIDRWEYECVWESQAIKDTHDKATSEYYKKGTFHGD